MRHPEGLGSFSVPTLSRTTPSAPRTPPPGQVLTHLRTAEAQCRVAFLSLFHLAAHLPRAFIIKRQSRKRGQPYDFVNISKSSDSATFCGTTFNLFMQPFHLFFVVVLIGSRVDTRWNMSFRCTAQGWGKCGVVLGSPQVQLVQYHWRSSLCCAVRPRDLTPVLHTSLEESTSDCTP